MPIDVAIVEDDPHVRKMLADWIRRAAGFRLAGEWSDVESAVGPVGVMKPNVVLMDINLPGMSGVEAVRKLKPKLPDTQFVMLTVYEDEDHIYNALAAGATAYGVRRASGNAADTAREAIRCATRRMAPADCTTAS